MEGKPPAERIAFVELCRVREFFHSLDVPCLAGMVRDQGHDVERFRLLLEGPEAGWARCADALVARLAARGVALAIVPNVLEDVVLHAVVRAGHPFRVMVLLYYSAGGEPAVTGPWLHSSSDDCDLRARVAAFAHAHATGAPYHAAPLPELLRAVQAPGPGRREKLLAWIDPFRPVLAYTDGLTGARVLERRQSIVGSQGCGYAADAADNPFFAGLDFDALPDLFRRGCSFCHNSGVVRLPPGETLDRLMVQLEEVRRQVPDLEEVLIEDEEFLVLLEDFARRVRASGGAPLRVLVKTRLLLLEKFAARLTAALQVFDGTGYEIDLYLIGFENFSQAELDRFNKGVRVEAVWAAVELLRDLRARFPATFSDRYNAKGFILFTPWTALADLRANVRAFRTLRFWELRGNVGLSKLRLDPSLPLYHAARRDGLLEPAYETAGYDNARRYGYTGETPWRFRHPETAAIYEAYLWATERQPDLMTRVRDREDRAAQIAVLEQLVALVTAQPALAGPPLQQALADWGRKSEVGSMKSEVWVRTLPPSASHLTPDGAPPGPALLPASPGANPSIAPQTMPFCNCNCVFCSDGGSPNIARKYTTDAAAELFAAIDQWGGAVVDLTTIVGGEPSIHPLFLALLSRAQARSREVFLLTNGRRFAYPAFTRQALDAGLTRVQVSLHGHRPEIHDALTRAPGSFAQSWAGAQCLARELRRRRSRRPLEFCFVVTNRNYRWLPEFLALVRTLPGPVKVNFTTLIPRGWGERHYAHLAVRYQDVLPFARPAAAMFGGRDGRLRCSFQMPPCVAPDLTEQAGEPFDCDGAIAAHPCHGPPCGSCDRRDRCQGPFEAYAALFGWEEFTPLSAAALAPVMP